MLCVIIIQVRWFSSTIPVVSFKTFSAVAGSSAAVCSSKSRSFGGFKVAIIKVSACLCPPDNNPTGWLMRFSSPISRSATRSLNSSLSALETARSQPPFPAASARFSSTVIPGALPRIGSWNSLPICFARVCSGIREISCPSSARVPQSVIKLPAMALNSVDFPAPFAPIIVIKSPFSTWRERSSSAFLASMVPGLKVLEIWEISSMVLFSIVLSSIIPSSF